ncbi:MAG: hypothetical protein RLZZ501_711, partial [Pseudomonadota bacterium]
DDLELFKLKHLEEVKSKSTHHELNLLEMPFHIPPGKMETVLDWSYSNGRDLFEIGRASARDFLSKHPGLLP